MSADPLSWPGYVEQLAAAASQSGSDESVTVDTRAWNGCEAVVVQWHFDFLGGSVNAVAGQRIAEAYDWARERRLPIVLFTHTGGSRMQEGMASLVQIPAAVVAQRAHARAGLLQIAVLGHPTTGGVFASFGSLADVTLAVEGATIGFAGPRVAEALASSPLPEGSHTAEGAVAAGLADALVPKDDVDTVVGAVLAWTQASRPRAVAAPAHVDAPAASPWAEVELARATNRARAAEFLASLDVAVELRGDRSGADDPAIRVVLATLLGRRVVVVAMDRRGNDARITPSGYRKAWRGLRLAGRLGVPLVTLVDTPGADATAASEAGGIAHHIARTFDEILGCDAPTVSLVIGEGGSGGALALAATDALLIQEHAIFSVIAPEGAAAILHRDAARAAEVAELLDPTAHRLHELGVADAVVPEHEGDQVDTAWRAVAAHLDRLAEPTVDERLAARVARWRHPLGRPDG